MPPSVKQFLQELRSSRQSGRLLAFWLLAACCAIALVWTVALSKIHDDRLDVRQNAERDTSAMVKSYSEQIARSIDYIDHLTLALKYQWQKDATSVDLEQQQKDGFFPLANYFYITLADQRGEIISTTLAREGRTNVASHEYFNAHRESLGSGLRITKPMAGERSQETVVLFTRRLERADGAFAGVIILAVTPDFFATFKNEVVLGPDDCLSVRYIDGTKLVAKLGGNVRHLDTLFRSNPDFSAVRGLMHMEKTDFVDSKARLVAWHQAQDYPLVAGIALSEKEMFARHEETAGLYRQMAWLASLAFLAAALVGSALSARLAWRNEQAEEIKDTYRLATDGAQEGFLMIRAIQDVNYQITDFLVEDCNERGALLVKHTKSSLAGARFSQLYSNRHFTHLMEIFSSAVASGFYEDEFSMRCPGQPNRWLYRRLVRAGNSSIAMTLRDITESKTYAEKLAAMANYDALTSLRNRHWLTAFLPGAIDAARARGTILALLFIDLNKFKHINDAVGHATGDQLLSAVALRLNSLLRPGDEAVRIGGDEFTIILSNLTHADEISQVANRICAAIEEPFLLQNQVFRIGASIGASFFPRDGQDADALLKNADMAMYCAKEERTSSVRFYEPAMYDRLKARAACEQELLAAIDERQLVPYYQPRADTVTREITGMEALVRWMHPVRGIVPPNDFIPLAEETGLVIAIGELVMDQACAQIAQWKAQGLVPVPVSVNVSARQFSEGGVKHLIQKCLTKHDVAAHLLEIELTESAMLGDSQAVVEEVAAISALGVKIHIDDFGTGYSSLSLLHRLDMDVLKIDRAFTSQLGNGKGGEVLFQAIVSMAKALDMRVVAEGVETEAQCRIIQNLKVDEIQGYLISRPLPAEGATKFLIRCREFTSSAMPA